MALGSKWSFLFMIIPGVFSDVSRPADITTSVHEDAVFLWNTTRNDIFEVKWGLFDGANVLPFFIKVSTGSKGLPTYSLDLDDKASRYKNRVHFIGNITLGRPWFVLSNLTTDDTKIYGIRIIETDGNVIKDQVKLTVLPAPTTTVPPTTTATNTTATGSSTAPSSSTTIGSTTKNGTDSDSEALSDGAIAGISVAVIVVVVVIVVLAVCMWKKKKDKKKGLRIPMS